MDLFKSRVLYVHLCILINSIIFNTAYGYTTPSAIQIKNSTSIADYIHITPKVTGILDVYNINKKGQVNFEPICITNTSQQPVKVLLKNIDVLNQGGLILKDVPLSKQNSRKEGYLYLVDTTNLTSYIIGNRSYNMDCAILEPNEQITFKIDGELNKKCTSWTVDDNISLNIHFELVPVEAIHEGIVLKDYSNEEIKTDQTSRVTPGAFQTAIK